MRRRSFCVSAQVPTVSGLTLHDDFGIADAEGRAAVIPPGGAMELTVAMDVAQVGRSDEN